MSVIGLVENRSGIGNAANYTPLVRIYADASCLRNGSIDSSAGAGAVILDHNRLEIRLIGNYLGQITNQQAEILACTRALEQLRRCCCIEIVSDSKYVIDTMMGRNRMRTNRSFWTRLVKACYGHHVSWKWVKGHSGIALQEVSDRLARAAARVGCDLSDSELSRLSGHISVGADNINIREFELELEKLVSQYEVQHQSFVPPSNFDVNGTFPSAFSA
ncbi:MAG TPA: hypothetical protein PKC65_01955 [Pyrinomonadaceae bacterium]|mgnify:CR=1 FL=1|nr:hypothetical protein [Pyrinomonadaceae bacterium]